MIRFKRIFVGVVLVASGATVAAERSESRHSYQVEIDLAARTIRVEARVPGATKLRARHVDATDFLRQRRSCDGRPLKVVRGEMFLGGTRTSCVQYDVVMPQPDRKSRWQRVDVADDIIWTTASRWLWLPDNQRPVVVRFDDSVADRIFVPWQYKGNGEFTIPKSPRSGDTVTVFGNFKRLGVAVPNGTIDVALLSGQRPLDASKIAAWLSSALMQVAQASGKFPNPAAKVVVLPVAGASSDRSPVPFGHVIRDGGETVQFFVDAAQPLSRYLADWTATHEFSHLMLPYLGVDGKWISEGFASYYQNVLMARGGRYNEPQAWEKLDKGFRHARAESPSYSPIEASRAGIGEARMMIYWSGAAFALIIDAELRAASNGAQSLDSVLGQLASCCLPADRRWTPTELMTKLDQLSETSLFSDRYREIGSSRGMPALADLYQHLGIKMTGSKVVLNDTAPGAKTRAQIMVQLSNDDLLEGDD